MEVSTGAFHALDDIGTFIWERLTRPTLVAALLADVQESYEVVPEQCDIEVLALLDHMLDSSLSESAIRRLLSLSWRDRALLAETVAWLAAARLAVVLLPCRVLARRLGIHMAESPWTETPAPPPHIGWAIRAVASHTPWRSMCLEQAIAAKAMLRRRHIPNTLYLGVAPGRSVGHPSAIAHAWVRSGMVHVTGGIDIRGYGIVSSFADMLGR